MASLMQKVYPETVCVYKRRPKVRDFHLPELRPRADIDARAEATVQDLILDPKLTETEAAAVELVLVRCRLFQKDLERIAEERDRLLKVHNED